MLSDHTLSILIFAGIDVIMALSFYLPASAGQLSAGQGGFMALGAYTAAYLTVQHGAPFPLALAAGGLVGGLVGLAVGFPALRLRGLYLVLVTFGFGEMVRVLFLNAPAFGGPGGFAGIPPETTIWHVLGLLIVLVYFFTRLSGSRMGRAFAALRDDEAAAEAMGVNSTPRELLGRRRGRDDPLDTSRAPALGEGLARDLLRAPRADHDARAAARVARPDLAGPALPAR